MKVAASSGADAVTATDRRISTEQGTLFARRWVPRDVRADAPAPIVLFHDSLGCVELWRNFPEQLAVATHRSVVAYDRLGFGRSDEHPGPLPLTFIHDEAAMVVPRVCDALGLDAIIPFGHSVGGGMAIATAARWPERCAAVVTESAQTFVEDRTRAGLEAARVEFARPGQLERLARYHGTKARWVLDAWIETWLSPQFADWRLDDDLQLVRGPALALHGDQDEYGSAEHPGRIARLTQGVSKAVILEGFGHVPHREQPARVLAEVAGFLASLSSDVG
jgi:pimeloyl-ACP methyl ester carboxylesterase